MIKEEERESMLLVVFYFNQKFSFNIIYNNFLIFVKIMFQSREFANIFYIIF
jgi:hypothetical protein